MKLGITHLNSQYTTMYKLLIVDDEPLVQIGIKSILNWSDYDIEVCATAVNGNTH